MQHSVESQTHLEGSRRQAWRRSVSVNGYKVEGKHRSSYQCVKPCCRNTRQGYAKASLNILFPLILLRTIAMTYYVVFTVISRAPTPIDIIMR